MQQPLRLTYMQENQCNRLDEFHPTSNCTCLLIPLIQSYLLSTARFQVFLARTSPVPHSTSISFSSQFGSFFQSSSTSAILSKSSSMQSPFPPDDLLLRPGCASCQPWKLLEVLMYSIF